MRYVVRAAAFSGAAAVCLLVGALFGSHPFLALVAGLSAAVLLITQRTFRRHGHHAAAPAPATVPARHASIGVYIAAVALVIMPLIERLGAAGVLSNPMVAIGMIATAGAGIAAVVITARQYSVSKTALVCVGAYLLLVLVAAKRNNWTFVAWTRPYALAQVVTWTLVFGLGLVCGAATARTRDRDLISIAAVGGMWLVIAVSVLLRLAGVDLNTGGQFTGSGNASLLAALGVHVERIIFPLLSSPNGMGALAGAGLVTSLAVVLHPRAADRPLLRRVAGALVLTSLVTLVFVDSRAAVVIAVLLTVAWRSRWRVGRVVLLAPIVLLPVSSLVLTSVSQATTQQAASLHLVRQGANDLTTGRTLIWRPIHEFISSHFSDAVAGYGLFGQTITGLSSFYNTGFYGVDERPELLPVHNFALQSILDVGFAGLALIVVGLVVIVGGVATTARASVGDAVVLVAVAFFACLGWTEAAPTESNPYLLIPWLGLLGVAVTRCTRAGRLVVTEPRPSTSDGRGASAPGVPSGVLPNLREAPRARATGRPGLP
jgi:O-antigen ligase